MATSSEDVELTEAGVPGGFAPVSTSDAVLAVLEGEETALGADGSTLEGTAKGGKKGGKKGWKKASDGEEQGEAMGAVSVSALFRFAEAKDYVLTAIAMLCALFSGANQPAQLIIFGNILDAFNKGDDSEAQSTINLLACLYVAVGAQMALTSFAQTACMSAVSGRMTKKIRELYYKALLRQDITFFDEHDQGSLASSIMETTMVIQDGLGEKFALAVQFVSSFVFGLAVALYYSWQLALLIIAIVPVMAGTLGLVAGMLQKANDESSAAYNEAGGTAQESLGAIRTLASLTGELREIIKYKGQLTRAEATGITRAKTMACVAALVSLIMWCAYALGLWFGSKLIADDMDAHEKCNYKINGNGELVEPDSSCITGGDVMICFFSVLFGGLNLGQAVPGFTAIATACREAFKVFEVIDRQSKIDPSSDEGTVPSSIQGKIELKDVQFAYPMRPDHLVYKGTNLTIEPGQTVALVGPSGCGKSTAVQLVERFYDPKAGAVLLDGTDLKELKVSWLRQQIGLVSQEPTLFSGTIFDNIASGKPGATVQDVEEAAALSNAHGFITGFQEGYQTQVGDKGVQLSGGQKQRIAIARAIVRDPSILILDEATSALDTTSEKVVQAALDKLLLAKKRTTIIIAHRLSTIRNADKIVVLNEGEVVEQGTHDELLAKDASLYATLVNMQLSASGEGSSSATGAIMGALSAVISSGEAGVTEVEVEAGEQKDEVTADGEETDALRGDVAVDVETGETEKKKEKEEKGEAAASKEELADEDKKKYNARAVSKWIWGLTKPERGYLGFGLVGATLIGCGFPLLGYFLAEMIGVFFNVDTWDMRYEASMWACVFVGMAVTQFIGAFLSQYCFGVITERLACRVRGMSYARMLEQDITWFDEPGNTAGALSSRLATDCISIKAFAGERTATSTSQIVTLIVCFSIAFSKCWQMTLVMLGLIPLIGGAFALQIAFVSGATADTGESTNAAGAEVSEALLNIRTIGAFGLEGKSSERFGTHLDVPLQQFIKKGVVTGLGMGFGQFVILSGAGLSYYVGGILYKDGEATFDEIMAVILCVMFGAIGLGQFAADASDKAEALTAAGKIMKLWDHKGTINALDDTKGATPTKVEGAIELRDLHFAYPQRPDAEVYAGLNLTIEPGQTVALVGPSGCGKSTVVQLCERFYDPKAGAVLLDGTDLKELKVSWLRQQIGLVSQEPTLFSGTIFDNIAAGKIGATAAEVESAAAQSNAHGFISDFKKGYQTEVGEKGVQLSGGQKQRIAIARAIVRDPSILILDEATSALDTKSEKVVQKALDDLLVAKKRTTIIIAHRLSTIRNADKIVVLMDGKVVEQGTHDELMGYGAAGHYRDLINSANSDGSEPEGVETSSVVG